MANGKSLLEGVSANRVRFEKPEYRTLTQSYSQTMDQDVVRHMRSLIQLLTGGDEGYVIKVVKGTQKPGLHIGRDFSNWSVVAWLDPCRAFYNLRLRRNTNVSGYEEIIESTSIKGTPHSVRAKVRPSTNINDIIELIHRSESAG